MPIKKNNAWSAAALSITVVVFVGFALWVTKDISVIFGLLALLSLVIFEEES